MYIQIKFVSKKSIYIELFDNSATRKWFEKFSSCKFSNATVVSNAYSRRPYLVKHHLQFPGTVNGIDYNWDNIKLTLKKLKDDGFNTDLFNLPNVFNFDQNLLNQLHRFFTYNQMWWANEHFDENPFDPYYKRKLTNQHDWKKLIEVINISVHNLEKYTTTDNSNILYKYPIEYLQVQFNVNPSDNSWIGFNLEEQQENYKYQEYKEKFKKPLVILDGSILGKSYLQSFLDHDDPTCLDCTGRLGSHGNFHIELSDDNRNNLYTSDDFKKWLLHYNIINPPLEFPIGMVIEPDSTLLKSIINSQIEDVIFFKNYPA